MEEDLELCHVRGWKEPREGRKHPSLGLKCSTAITDTTLHEKTGLVAFLSLNLYIYLYIYTHVYICINIYRGGREKWRIPGWFASGLDTNQAKGVKDETGGREHHPKPEEIVKERNESPTKEGGRRSVNIDNRLTIGTRECRGL